MEVLDFSKSVERYLVERNRQENAKGLRVMYQYGYRWIVRDLLGEINGFSLKLKK